MEQMLHEVEEPKYVIKVKGQIVSIPYSSRELATQFIGNLPQDQQLIAEVVAVTHQGQEILFG